MECNNALVTIEKVEPYGGPCKSTLYGSLVTTEAGYWWRYGNCVHNLARAFAERMVMRTHSFSMNSFARMVAVSIHLSQYTPFLMPVSPFLLAYRSGVGCRKGRKYLGGADRLLTRGVTDADADLTAFIKDENYPGFSVGSTMPWEFKGRKRIPRPIQFAKPVWYAALSQYTIPFEEWFLQLDFSSFCFPENGPSGRVIGKGLSLDARARVLRSKWDRFSEPVAFCLDGSKWDRQVNVAQLIACMVFIASCFGWPEDLVHMLMVQMVHYGEVKTMGYVFRYWLYGRRASGHLDTGDGNCLIFMIILISCLWDHVAWSHSWDFVVDGDDCVFFCEAADFDTAKSQIISGFTAAGHNLTVESVANQFQQITWCQSHPVRVLRDTCLVWTMCRDPRVIISKAYVHPNYSTTDKRCWKHLYMVALGELVLGRGLPIIQSWALKVLKEAKRRGVRPFDVTNVNSSLYRNLKSYLIEIGLHSELYRLPSPLTSVKGLDQLAIHASLLNRFSPQPILSDTRYDVWVAFGIDSATQIECESTICPPNWTHVYHEVGEELFTGFRAHNWAH